MSFKRLFWLMVAVVMVASFPTGVTLLARRDLLAQREIFECAVFVALLEGVMAVIGGVLIHSSPRLVTGPGRRPGGDAARGEAGEGKGNGRVAEVIRPRFGARSKEQGDSDGLQQA